LKRADVPFVHRQPGSGTRVWLEAQLRRLGIDPESIPAGEQVATTHSAVARAVVEGKARVGLTIYAAAASHGLDFLPLTKERYELVIPERAWQRPEAQTLAEFIRSNALRRRIEALGGYDASQTGEERWVR
jgi:putative molybdopterin biosynthesis protein